MGSIVHDIKVDSRHRPLNTASGLHNITWDMLYEACVQSKNDLKLDLAVIARVGNISETLVHKLEEDYIDGGSWEDADTQDRSHSILAWLCDIKAGTIS